MSLMIEAQKLCENGGGRNGSPDPDRPCGLSGRTASSSSNLVFYAQLTIVVISGRT